jgi:hypothetical protein
MLLAVLKLRRKTEETLKAIIKTFIGNIKRNLGELVKKVRWLKKGEFYWIRMSERGLKYKLYKV